MVDVWMIFRKKNPRFFSIEAVFDRIRNCWKEEQQPGRITLPKFGISVDNLRFVHAFASKHKHAIFHLTGDAHYVLLLLKSTHTILTIHDCGFAYQHRGFKKWVLKKLLLDWPVRHAGYITTISEQIKSEIVALTGCSPTKITVIPNPVSPLIFHRPLSFNSANPVLLFVGVTPNKNMDRVIHALRNIPCVLRIIGSVSVEQKQLLDQCGVRWESIFGISDQDVANEYAAADIVLFPSLYEGFGLPIIEGFKAGRPVITSNLSPMKEIASGAACLVDPIQVESIRQGVLKVIGDETYRRDLIDKGLERVKQYQPQMIADQYYTLYQTVQGAICAE